MNKFFRTIGIILTFSIMLSTFAFAANSTTDNTLCTVPESNEEAIDKLLDERASILSKIFLEQNSTQSNELLFELNNKDLELTRLGVQFLSDAQIQNMFPESKTNKALSLSGLTSTQSETDSIAPRVSVPESSYNTWTLRTSTLTVDGVSYNVQKLIAQPASSSSPLTNVGTRTINYDTNWKAGAVNVLKSVATSLVGGAAGTVPGANVAVSFLDAVAAYVTGISSTTEVDVPHIAYTWSNVTTASFTYVRLSSQSDYYQWLSLICTKANAEVRYTIPSFCKANGTIIYPKTISDTRDIHAMNTDYNSSDLAVSIYKSNASAPYQSCIDKIKLTAPGSKSIQTVSICYPSMPIHCEP